MVELKPGAKFQSTVCTTQVIITKGSGEVDLRCGGSPMVAAGHASVEGQPSADMSDGTLLGKRYRDDTGTVEMLCTKAGAGSMSIGDSRIEVALTKALPASD